MKCPHCHISFHEEWVWPWQGAEDADTKKFVLRHCNCPACKRSILVIEQKARHAPDRNRMIYPLGTLRPLAAEVPAPFSADFREAVEVLAISAKASAALSRRNLQAVLRDVLKVKRSDLSKEIQEFIDRPSTPSDLKENVDAVRNIGNFAAHPTKNTNTGDIVDVEPEEAEWLLDVLESLFDFCFVQPAKNLARKAALNVKLQSAGKPPMR